MSSVQKVRVTSVVDGETVEATLHQKKEVRECSRCGFEVHWPDSPDGEPLIEEERCTEHNAEKRGGRWF